MNELQKKRKYNNNKVDTWKKIHTDSLYRINKTTFMFYNIRIGGIEYNNYNTAFKEAVKKIRMWEILKQ